MLHSKISRGIIKDRQKIKTAETIEIQLLSLHFKFNQLIQKVARKFVHFGNTFGKQTTFIDSFGLVKNLFDGLITIIIIIGKKSRTERSEKEESQNSTPFF